jgi:acyl-[acyl-carrier-protein] desaturase
MNSLLPQHREVLNDITTDVQAIVDNHMAQQNLWYPSELLPALEDFKRHDLPPELASGLVLNLLTEDGLPYFLALLVAHLGDEGPLFEWSKIWTAEEDRHGAAIKMYLHRTLRRDQLIRVEKMQANYLSSGFWPEWSKDPYRLLAYVVMQERATQYSHAAIARRAASVDPVLRTMMSKIAGDESRHHDAYVGMFRALLERNPSHAIEAFYLVIKNFAMPGANVPGFSELSIIQDRTGMFGAKEFADIIVEATDKLNFWSLTDLDERGENARDSIDKTIKLLRRVAERSAKQSKRTLQINFLGDNVTVEV